MKEDSKRLLRGMTEVSDQYILEAEAFYQKKDEDDSDRENEVKYIKENKIKDKKEKESKEKQEKEYQYKECYNEEGGNRESIEKEKKIIKIQEAKKRKSITIPRVLGFTASIAAACFVCYIGVFMFFAPRAAKPSSVMLEGAQGEDSGGIQDKAEEFAAEGGELKEISAGITAKGRSVEEVESMQQATELTGFTMRIPEGKAPYTEKTISVIREDMIEVAYSKEEPCAVGYSVRKARAEGDISGDYTEYTETREVDSEGRKVTLKGEAGTCSLALWEENGFSYAVQAQEKPMTEEEILEIVKAVE